MLQLRFSNSAKPAMWLVAQKYTFGSKKDCDCLLEQDGIAPVHAQITVAGEVVTLVRMDASSALSVNGISVLESRQLAPGDIILMGDAELAIADPKSEGPRRDYSDRTSLRQAINVPSQEPASEPTWHLRPLNTTLAKSEGFELSGTMLLGRSKECDICIPASHLSRKHAKFIVSASGLTVEDLGSSNGTFINGSKIHRISLNHGDEVNFDTLRFRVEAKKAFDDVTTLRPSLDETQIRQAVSTNQVKKSLPPSGRKAPPVRPKMPGHSKPQQAEESTGDTVKLLLGAVIVIAVVASLVWFLLS